MRKLPKRKTAGLRAKVRTQGLEHAVRRENIQKIILKSIAAAGALSLAAIATNAMLVFGPLTGIVLSYQQRHYMYRALRRLEDAGHLDIERGKGKFKISLTESGKQKLNAMLFRALPPPKKRRWDGNWQIVIYDIKEYRRRDRRLLQQALRHAEFYRFQASVWVSPYPCEELIALLKAYLKIGKDVQYIIAKHV